ncbi:MAG: glycoside hydrolase family 3 N-terminal domain-containing protein [Myxococcota bacterium]
MYNHDRPLPLFGKETTCNLTRDEIEERVASVLKHLTLEEKVRVLNGHWDPIRNFIRHRNPYNPVPIETPGLPRLGVSPIAFSDGPRGVVMGKATCFPVAMARGATFDRALEQRVGDVVGKECRAQGANTFAGVCINVLRHPAWGRSQETYGEDPYHLGEMGVAMVNGVQEHNVMACLKHYALNNIENSRFFVDVRVDDRALHEVYLPQFKKGIEAGAASVMGAYNLYEGDQACESHKLLTEILREDWGFEGFTISDFLFGIRDTKKAIEAGLDVEMPMPVHYARALLEAVQRGDVAEHNVDASVRRVLRTLTVFENTPDPQTYPQDLVAHPDHVALAREVAEASMVLVKNDDQTLPLDKGAMKRVLILGKLAGRENTGDHGSSRIFAPHVVTPLAGIQALLGRQVKIIHLDERNLEKARRLAATVDGVIIVAGHDYHDEGESLSPGDTAQLAAPIADGYRNQGMGLKAFLVRQLAGMLGYFYGGNQRSPGKLPGGDRESLSLPADQVAMIEAVSGIHPNTVVTLVCGGMVLLDSWAERVPAVLYGWYAGMEGGHALARILFGEVAPSGRLPFTLPRTPSQLPYFSNTDATMEYGMYHGYSLLDKNGHSPRLPFGFGLSYTSVEYANLQVSVRDDAVDVSVTVTNTGDRAGNEVVQVYIGAEDATLERPRKLLKGFEKVRLQPGESLHVTVRVAKRELRMFNPSSKTWALEPGTYRIWAGPNADESTALQATVEMTTSDDVVSPR